MHVWRRQGQNPCPFGRKPHALLMGYPAAYPIQSRRSSLRSRRHGVYKEGFEHTLKRQGRIQIDIHVERKAIFKKGFCVYVDQNPYLNIAFLENVFLSYSIFPFQLWHIKIALLRKGAYHIQNHGTKYEIKINKGFVK